MPQVTFIDATGTRHTVDTEGASTLMEAAIASDVPSIVGFCGGGAACGTCHCYVPEDWAARLPPPDLAEQDMLKQVLDRRPSSRLACQIQLSGALDGLTVELPARQRTP